MDPSCLQQALASFQLNAGSGEGSEDFLQQDQFERVAAFFLCSWFEHVFDIILQTRWFPLDSFSTGFRFHVCLIQLVREN